MEDKIWAIHTEDLTFENEAGTVFEQPIMSGGSPKYPDWTRFRFTCRAPKP